MSDEVMAKKLGWRKLKSPMNPKVPCWHPTPGHQGKDYYFELPRFTKSLDAIVAEIEARGLHWGVTIWNNGKGYSATCLRPVDEGGTCMGSRASTAPLALCHALCQYLSDTQTKKPGGE